MGQGAGLIGPMGQGRPHWTHRVAPGSTALPAFSTLGFAPLGPPPGWSGRLACWCVWYRARALPPASHPPRFRRSDPVRWTGDAVAGARALTCCCKNPKPKTLIN